MLTTLILAAVLQIQTPPAFLWDYATADLTTGAVDRFELKLDAGEWTDVGRLASDDQSEAPAGTTTYTVRIPPLTLGEHTAMLRACNPVECSEPTSLTFVVSIKPVPPGHFRVGGKK
jgi:hypothetical protein